MKLIELKKNKELLKIQLENIKNALPYAKTLKEIICNTQRLNSKTKCFEVSILRYRIIICFPSV